MNHEEQNELLREKLIRVNERLFEAERKLARYEGEPNFWLILMRDIPLNVVTIYGYQHNATADWKDREGYIATVPVRIDGDLLKERDAQ